MKKKITKIILAVCLVVAGLPLFAIGARANDDANTNSEMMISVDNYFDYRNAKLILSVLQMLAFLGEVQHNHTLLFALQLVAILSSSILITTIERELNIMRERLLVTV